MKTMQLFPDTKIILSIGGLHVTWYAVLILTGVLAAYFLAQNTMKKWGYSKTILEDYVIPMMALSIIGARLYYVIFEWDFYSAHPDQIIAIWNGGLAIYGGLIVGVLYSIYYFKRQRISALRMADCIMPGVMVAQAFGRWGNFMNQEAFGKIVPESYYALFPSFIKDQMYIQGAYREPTFLYESAGNILGFLFIYFIFRKRFYKRRGDCAFMYCIWYGVLRFLVEGLRTDSLMIGSFRVSQLVSLAIILLGVLGLTGILHKAFHWNQKPVILFDLDGTLQDSQHLVFETFKEVFRIRKPEHKLSQEELYSFFGPTLEETFLKYFKKEELDDVIALYQKINIRLHDTLLKPMPNAFETVSTLHEQGYKMAVVSNKRIGIVKMGLKAIHLEPYFDVVLGKEQLPEPKPSPSGLLEACNLLKVGHDDVIYVGDNVTDILCAKNMAAYSVGFSNDERQLEQQKQAHPCKQITDLRELIELCKEERAWSDNTIW